MAPMGMAADQALERCNLHVEAMPDWHDLQRAYPIDG